MPNMPKSKMLILAASAADAQQFLDERRRDVPAVFWPAGREYDVTVATWDGGGLKGDEFDAVIVTRQVADVAQPVAHRHVRAGGWLWVDCVEPARVAGEA